MMMPNYLDGRFDAEKEIAKSHFDLGEICKSIGSFGNDPPEGAYQRGYLKRLLQLASDSLKTHPL